MTERERACIVTTLGAIAGAITSYLLFTDRGRAFRRQILPALDDFEQELSHFRGTVARTAGMASEGWKMLNEVIGESPSPALRPTSPHQTIPF